MDNKIWAWQPFGPDESIMSFSLAGNHYRGFPVVKVTDEEKQQIERGERFEFTFKKTRYILDNNVISAK